MKRLFIILFSALLFVAPFASHAESVEQSVTYPLEFDSAELYRCAYESLPFTINYNGCTIEATSITAYTAEIYHKEDIRNVVVLDMDVSALDDSVLPTLCQDIDVYISERDYSMDSEHMYNAVSIVYLDKKTASFIFVYEGEQLTDKKWSLSIFFDSAIPYCYVTTFKGTEPVSKRYIYETGIEFETDLIKPYRDLPYSIDDLF